MYDLAAGAPGSAGPRRTATALVPKMFAFDAVFPQDSEQVRGRGRQPGARRQPRARAAEGARKVRRPGPRRRFLFLVTAGPRRGAPGKTPRLREPPDKPRASPGFGAPGPLSVCPAHAGTTRGCVRGGSVAGVRMRAPVSSMRLAVRMRAPGCHPCGWPARAACAACACVLSACPVSTETTPRPGPVRARPPRPWGLPDSAPPPGGGLLGDSGRRAPVSGQWGRWLHLFLRPHKPWYEPPHHPLCCLWGDRGAFYLSGGWACGGLMERKPKPSGLEGGGLWSRLEEGLGSQWPRTGPRGQAGPRGQRGGPDGGRGPQARPTP